MVFGAPTSTVSRLGETVLIGEGIVAPDDVTILREEIAGDANLEEAERGEAKRCSPPSGSDVHYLRLLGDVVTAVLTG